MASYDAELLEAARRLIVRRSGQLGKLPSARVRRSISTSYYALFHFLLEEIGVRMVGSHNDFRARRRILARTVTHAGLKTALGKVRSQTIDASIADFLRSPGISGAIATPRFVRNLASAFIDAQTKRHEADYDLNKPLSSRDARLLLTRVRQVIAGWREATSSSDRNFKNALCLLILLKGTLRAESQ